MFHIFIYDIGRYLEHLSSEWFRVVAIRCDDRVAARHWSRDKGLQTINFPSAGLYPYSYLCITYIQSNGFRFLKTHWNCLDSGKLAVTSKQSFRLDTMMLRTKVDWFLFFYALATSKVISKQGVLKVWQAIGLGRIQKTSFQFRQAEREVSLFLFFYLSIVE